MKRCCGTQRKHFRLGLRDTGYAEGAQRSFRMVVSERDYDQVLRLDRWIGQASNQLLNATNDVPEMLEEQDRSTVLSPSSFFRRAQPSAIARAAPRARAHQPAALLDPLIRQHPQRWWRGLAAERARTLHRSWSPRLRA